MSLARNVAILNLLIASRPEVADLAVQIRIGESGGMQLSTHSQQTDAPGVAARLAKALRVEVQTYSGTSTDGERFISHEVHGTFYSVPVDFYGYEYPDRAQAGDAS